MNNLNKLKKLNKPNIKTILNKNIAIPTEKELYNLITNIYILKSIYNFEYYIKSDFLIYAKYYTKHITKRLKDKIKNNNYDFNFGELVKYIDTSIKQDYDFTIYDIIDDYNFLIKTQDQTNKTEPISITDLINNNQDYYELLKNPYIYFLEHTEHIGDIDIKIKLNTFMKILKNYVNSKDYIALNKPIGYIK